MPAALSHVYWIGGATDAGKSTVARILAERHGLQVYHYDRRDAAHVEQLARTSAEYRAFLSASLHERWVAPEPDELFRRTLRSFYDRFPLMVEDILALPVEPRILAEGFGLLPDLLTPLLTRPCQAVWLIPSANFKDASMTRRGKPSFAPQVADPERAKRNIHERDRLLAEYVRGQIQAYGLRLIEVDGSRSAEAMADELEAWFEMDKA